MSTKSKTGAKLVASVRKSKTGTVVKPHNALIQMNRNLSPKRLLPGQHQKQRLTSRHQQQRQTRIVETSSVMVAAYGRIDGRVK